VNAPSVFTVIAGVLIAAGVLLFGQGGGGDHIVTPPDDVIVAPDVQLTGIARQAKESADDYPVRAAANLREAKRRLESGEFKNPNEARAWLADENTKARKAAFQAWHESLDKAIEQGRLPQALGESAAGFDAAGGKK